MENATIRHATLEDKKEVLAINDNVFGGRDYLPALYDSLISSPNTTGFALSYNDKIIAFGGATIVDDGQTGVGRGGRVHPEYKGFHLVQRRLLNYFVEWAMAKGVIRHAATEIQSGSAPILRENHDLVLSKILLAYMANVNQLRLHHVHDTNIAELSLVTDVNLSTYFESQKISSYLFMHERILVNGIPYRLWETNIPLIMQTCGITEMYTNVNVKNNECKGLLSIGTVYPVRRPSYAYNLEIYGEDQYSLECHIMHHLRRVVDKTAGDVSIYVFIDTTFPLKKIDQIFSKYEVRRDNLHGTKNTEEITGKRVLSEITFQPQSRY